VIGNPRADNEPAFDDTLEADVNFFLGGAVGPNVAMRSIPTSDGAAIFDEVSTQFGFLCCGKTGPTQRKERAKPAPDGARRNEYTLQGSGAAGKSGRLPVSRCLISDR